MFLTIFGLGLGITLGGVSVAVLYGMSRPAQLRSQIAALKLENRSLRAANKDLTCLLAESERTLTETNEENNVLNRTLANLGANLSYTDVTRLAEQAQNQVADLKAQLARFTTRQP